MRALPSVAFVLGCALVACGSTDDASGVAAPGSPTSSAASGASPPGPAALPSSDASADAPLDASTNGNGDASASDAGPKAPPTTFTSDTDLCGAHAYGGAFVVKAGVNVTCSSGELVIDADTIVIEDGASISVAATSTATGGLDAKPCYDGSYIGQTVYYSGASGGGHGSLGTPGGTGYAGSDPGGANCHSCYGPNGGGLVGSQDDMLVEPGTRGGNGCAGGGTANGCPNGNGLPGGLGGGVIRLRAASAIDIRGDVHADGAAGAPMPQFDNGGGTGGGSGGGVLLAAPTITIGAAANVTVRGGGGGGGWRVTSCTYEGPFDSRGGMGGKGRIKVQTKAPPTVQGTLDGDTAFGALP